ncbi:MAG TPA: glycosyltransferase [Chryseosolibacter sp.]
MRVLVAPLDWGLGHATRCIPVIRELQRQGCDVMIAGSGDSLRLLKKEFPSVRAFDLPAYEPRYPSSGSMAWTMACQLPRFMRVISEEHDVVGKLIARENVQRVISDNRYGCWSERIPAALITHQSNILMPDGFGWMENFVAALNAKMIIQFTVCWIPDVPGEHSLAGRLTAFEKSGARIRKEYIGWLSRFQVSGNVNKIYDVLAVFSGPEPQRTIFENKVACQLKNSRLEYRVVRGLPACGEPPADERTVNFLSSADLQREMESASLVIARSGYSTVMDMATLGKKALFVPTPGQTEQEYLAERLTQKGIAFHTKQKTFDLETAMEEARRFSGFPVAPENSLLAEAIKRFLA